MEYLDNIGKRAQAAKPDLQHLKSEEKNQILRKSADDLKLHATEILAANEKDMEKGRTNGMSQGLLDRLLLTEDRIAQIAEGLYQIAALDDPIGEVLGMKQRPNGLRIGQKRVPLGVVGIIYEARPNVTADAFGLCFKTGNVVILKGGSDAFHSIQAIVTCIRRTLSEANVNPDALLLIEDTSRETTAAFMKLNRYVDVLIPRGGAGLIRAVVENSTIPVIETGTGNCHVYVDKDADFDMAVNIINNAKTQRISVCNACESIVVHSAIAEEFLPKLYDKLREHHVQLHCDERAQAILAGRDDVTEATADDWGMEYLDYIRLLTVLMRQSSISTDTTHHIQRQSSQMITTMRRSS